MGPRTTSTTSLPRSTEESVLLPTSSQETSASVPSLLAIPTRALLGLADHWPCCSFHHWRVPLLLHLLLLLRNPGLPLLLLQGAVGTRATPPLELAKPSFPPSRLSGTHLNIGKIFGTSSRIYRPSSEIYREKLIFSPQI